MSNKLFVGGLSYNTSQNDLQDAFSAHGTVMEATIINDRDTGKSKGFGFVTMSNDTEAQEAINGLNGASLDGRSLTVNVARPREDRGGSGYSRGGGGGGGRSRY